MNAAFGSFEFFVICSCGEYIKVRPDISQQPTYSIKRYCSRCGKEYNIDMSITLAPKGAAEAKSKRA